MLSKSQLHFWYEDQGETASKSPEAAVRDAVRMSGLSIHTLDTCPASEQQQGGSGCPNQSWAWRSPCAEQSTVTQADRQLWGVAGTLTPRKVVEPEQDERLHWGSSTQLLSRKRPSVGLVRTRLERVVVRSLHTTGKAHPLIDVPLNSVSADSTQLLTTVSTGHQGSPGQRGKFSEPRTLEG